jgi:hypothetical protein
MINASPSSSSKYSAIDVGLRDPQEMVEELIASTFHLTSTSLPEIDLRLDSHTSGFS